MERVIDATKINRYLKCARRIFTSELIKDDGELSWSEFEMQMFKDDTPLTRKDEKIIVFVAQMLEKELTLALSKIEELENIMERMHERIKKLEVEQCRKGSL